MSELNFSDEISNYATITRSMRVASIAVMQGLIVQTKGVSTKIKDFIAENGYDTVEESNAKVFKLPPQKVAEFNRLDHIYDSLSKARNVMPQSFVVSMISNFDSYLGRLLKLMYLNNPSTLSESEREFKFSEIIKFDDIENLKHSIIEKEIESVLRKSHEDHFIYIEKKLGIKLRNLDVWKDFIELTERRNLFVHSDGVVSQQYINKCSEAGFKIPAEHIVGFRLPCDQKYISRAVDIMYEIGVKLGYVLWQKIRPEDIKMSESLFNDLVFDLMLHKNYKLAQNMYKMIIDYPRSSGNMRAASQVNYLQCLKWRGKSTDLASELKLFDVEVLEPRYKIAKAVLMDDFSIASKLMKDIPTEHISKDDYIIWPLFQKFRETSEFAEQYHSIFGEHPFIEEKVVLNSIDTGESTVDASEALNTELN